MSTTVTFDIATDDTALRAAVADVKDDDVLTWRLAIFCCQQQLEKAIKRRTIRDHYDAIHLRARAAREAKLAGTRQDEEGSEQ